MSHSSDPETEVAKLSEFREWPKIPRLARECIVTEKIDGTNASIFIGEDGLFLVGSRTRWLTEKEDNFGWWRWTHENEAQLRQLGPGHHFGEWWGSGIQRGYGLTKGERRFSLFNVGRWTKDFYFSGGLPKGMAHPPECCSIVPILYRGPFDTAAIEETLRNLQTWGSRAAPGFKSPEGVVVFHTAANHCFKKTIVGDATPKTLATA